MRGSATASASATSSMRVPRREAIVPHRPSCAASMAARPSRVASTRSEAVGAPPRWMCPSTVARVSKPVCSSIWRSSQWPTPPRRTCPNSSVCSRAARSLTAARHRALGHHHDREVAPTRVATTQRPAHLADVERALGDQDHVGPSRHSGVQGDPARAATHHLGDQDAMVALGGGVQAVDRLGGDLQRGVEAERHVGGAQVVVDRLGHPQDRQAVLVQAVGGAQRVLAADRDQPVEPQALERVAHALQARRRPCRGWCARCPGSSRRAAGCRPWPRGSAPCGRPPALPASRRESRPGRRRSRPRPCARSPG